MPAHEVNLIRPVPGVRSREVAWRLAELDDQLALLLEELAPLTPADLAWQSAPGMNTIGMLLAHLAIVEVFWSQIGLLGQAAPAPETVIGIGMDGDGIPIAAGAVPPATLAGRDLAWYRERLTEGRAFLKQTVRSRDEAWLDEELTRVRRNGTTHRYDRRWVLYHLLEHFAAHFGQILLIRHALRDAQAAATSPDPTR
jgi:uncharacterized damage-inducible protein DinB